MKIFISLEDENGNTYEGTANLSIQRAAKDPVQPVNNKEPNNKPVGPAAAILDLFNQEFFKAEKTRAVVVKALSDKGYNFDADHISMALNRAKYLVKRGPKGSLSFVQKYPPS